MNMTRCMLREKNLPHSFWGEAVVTACYVLNKCPTKQMNKVPEAIWSGHTPSVKHLRVFGCLCYRHIPDQRRKKLDDKSEAMILVGYHTTGAYKLYNPITKKVTASRDVTFEEDKYWDWNNTTSDNGDYVPFEFLMSKQLKKQLCQHLQLQNNETVILRRSERPIVPNRTMQDYERVSDDMVTPDGDIVHLALFFDTEPLTYVEASKHEKWRQAMT
ncbi:equilibrative nucleoside transporter 3-like protein [Trifolium pratense]|uniref:Equilibrative nucleoside transporter 3-like protein n=1 Tax=Trifolium pratense TaxID=57577 RepID=A0A2K3K8Q9_TRIPR|nr:equilibrative nucleoside transporter 3-like protein [Trifolium pratense]